MLVFWLKLLTLPSQFHDAEGLQRVFGFVANLAEPTVMGRDALVVWALLFDPCVEDFGLRQCVDGGLEIDGSR
jgi:hypothetical protein